MNEFECIASGAVEGWRGIEFWFDVLTVTFAPDSRAWRPYKGPGRRVKTELRLPALDVAKQGQG
ncbi:MAG: hypothetical protein AMXMBFR22_30530 [Phycisphaerae bacterium]